MKLQEFKTIEEQDNELLNKTENSIKSRRKRIAWLPILLIGALVSLAALAVANRADIEIAKNNVAILSKNQEVILTQVNKLSTNLNNLKYNQDKVIILVNNITAKLNDIIDDYNCHKMTTAEKMKFINTWSTITPNSFIRALNGALDNKLNIDILPGEYLQKIIQFYPDFANTIYANDPFLLYKSATTRLISLDRKNLILDILISVPRIMSTPFGKIYNQVSCHWKDEGRIMHLKQDGASAILNKDNIWYETIGCNTKDMITLCDVRLMKPYIHGCFSSNSTWNMTTCPVEMTNIEYKNEVLQTEAGVVVCNPGEKVTKFKRDSFGVLTTSIDTIKTPKFYTSYDADSLLVDINHYSLNSGNIAFNITYHYSIHNWTNTSGKISDLSYDPSFKEIEYLDQIKIKHTQQSIINWTIGIFCSLLLLALCYSIYLYNKRKNKTRKQLGFLMTKLNSHELKMLPAPQNDDNESIDDHNDINRL